MIPWILAIFLRKEKFRQACAEGNVGSSVWRFGFKAESILKSDDAGFMTAKICSKAVVAELCEESSTGLKETMLSPFKDISAVPSKMDRFWVIQKIRNHQQAGQPKSLPSLR